MKKRITSIILAACMFLLCSCGDKNPAKVGTGNVKTENQYVIAMNPSVAFEDGTVSIPQALIPYCGFDRIVRK